MLLALTVLVRCRKLGLPEELTEEEKVGGEGGVIVVGVGGGGDVVVGAITVVLQVPHARLACVARVGQKRVYVARGNCIVDALCALQRVCVRTCEYSSCTKPITNPTQQV